MAGRIPTTAAGLLAGMLVLAACEEGQGPAFLRPAATADAPEEGGVAAGSMVERDVEAPEVFSAEASGLWDGRPSLGGVWVAHPDTADPERVIIRNTGNGRFVIGSLFRRERETPGPAIQVSSDAAQELGMLAGQPAPLSVVALRREEVPAAPEAEAEDPETAETAEAEAPPDADSAAGIAATAEAALSAAEIEAATAAQTTRSGAQPAPPPGPEPAAPPPPPASSLEKPYIQIGIFSVEQNARNAGASLRTIGIVPTIRAQQLSGKPFWRVIVGPTTSADERRTVLGKVRELGYDDAYYVTH